MPKYISGRVKLRNQSDLSVDRYKYLDLGSAEPNLGFPPVGGSSDIPVGDQYQVISVINDDSEVNRYWIPVGGGIIPGSLSVYEEGTLVGGLSSTTQLDFRGNAITAVGSNTGQPNPGIAVTITVAPPGLDHQILFNNSGEFDGGSYFVYDNSTVGIASVGIGTSTPTQNLHVVGNLRLTGTIYDTDNKPGGNNNILKKNATGGIEWVRQEEVLSGAGGTVSQIQYHDDTGLVGGAPNFVWVEPPGGTGIGSVGIGSTQPKILLDVLGAARFSQLEITGVTTTAGLLDINAGATASTLAVEDLTEGRVAYVGSGNSLVDSSNLTFDGNVLITGEGFLATSGISTFGNITITGNTINTKVGGLTLDSSSGSITAADALNISDTTSSYDKDSGALVVDGGVGIEENLNVGAGISVTGISTFTGIGTFGNRLYVGEVLSVTGVTTLAGAGGSTTTGGDLHVRGFIYGDEGIVYDEGLFQRLIVSGVSTFKNDVELWGQTGIKSAFWDQSEDSFTFNDDAKVVFGTGGDLEVYYTEGTGSDGGSIFKHTGDHDMRFQVPAGSYDIVFETTSGDNLAVFNADGGTELLWRGDSGAGERLKTTQHGVEITGNINANGIVGSALSISGISTLGGPVGLGSDLNVVGLSTLGGPVGLGSDLSVTGLSTFVGIGTFEDKLYVDQLSVSGLSTFVGIGTFHNNLFVGGDLKVRGNVTYDQVTGVNMEVTGIATFKDDVEFWGNTGVAKSAYWDKSDNNFKFVDDSKLIFGDDSDLEIYHNNHGAEPNSVIEHSNSAASGLYLKSNQRVEITDENAVNLSLRFNNTGNYETELFYATTRRLITTSDGIDVSGLTTTTKLNVSGVSTFVGIGTFEDKLYADQLSVSGLSTFVGIGTFHNDLHVGGDLFIGGDIAYDEITGVNMRVTGIATIKDLHVTGISSFVGVSTFYDGILVSGISTFNDSVVIGGTIPGTYKLKIDVDDNASFQNVANFTNNTNSGLSLDIKTDLISIGSTTNTDLAFHTNNNTNERLRITKEGHVGIGTTNPVATNINSSLTGNGRVLAVGIVTANEYYGIFKGSIDSGVAIENANNVQITDDTSDSGLHYIHFGSETSGYDGVEVDSTGLAYRDGKVGIGTTNPLGRFSVFGNSNTNERFGIAQTTGTSFYPDNISDVVLNEGAGIAEATQVKGVLNLGSSYLQGSSYSAGSGSYRALKLYLYKDSNVDNAYGLGMSDGMLEIQSSATIGFFAGSSGTTGIKAERVRITSQGVGIGTTNITKAADSNNDYVLNAGIVTAREYYGTFKGTIDPGASITLDRIQQGDTKAEVIDTGSNGHFSVTTENEERLRITNTGVLEIERGSSSAQAIDIKTTATTGASRIRFMESGSATGELAYSHDNNQVELIGRSGKSAVIFTDDTESFRITSNGNVGIGTTNPNITVGVGNTAVLAVGVVTARELYGTFKGTIDSSVGITTDKIVQGNTSAEVVDTGSNGYFKVLTEGTERFRILADGKVGINSIDPQFDLDIVNNSNSYNNDTSLRLYNKETGASRDTVMRFQIAGTESANYIYFGDGEDSNAGQIVYSHSIDAMRFFTPLVRGVAGVATERLRITSSGDVGIGTGVPTNEVGIANTAVLAVGIVTAREVYGTFKGTIDSSVAISTDRIQQGNTSAEVVDSGSNGYFKVLTEGIERLNISNVGKSIFNSSEAEIAGFERIGSGSAKVNIKAGNNTGNSYLTFSDGDSAANTYSITVTASDSSNYTLSGTDRNGSVSGTDPTVTVETGDTLNFVVDASGHPFYIRVSDGGANVSTPAATNQGTQSGTVSWTPNTAGTYYYQCGSHSGMIGTITVTSASDPAEIGAINYEHADDTLKFEVWDRNNDNPTRKSRLQIGNLGQIGLSGANYGTDGQVLTSAGAGATPAWTSGSSVGKSYTLVGVDSGPNTTLRLSDGTTNDDVLITAGTNVSFADTTADGFTINATTSAKTYTLEGVESGANAILRLSDGSTNDDVLITAGTNVSFADTTAGGFTINATTGAGTLTNVEVKQYSDNADPRTERTCKDPIGVVVNAGIATIGIGTTSNAYGARYIQESEPTGSSVCDGDIWFDTANLGGGSAVAGTNRQIQFNDGGVQAGAANLEFYKSTTYPSLILKPSDTSSTAHGGYIRVQNANSSNWSEITGDGALELFRSDNTHTYGGPYIDFKYTSALDMDSRIQMDTVGGTTTSDHFSDIIFATGGGGIYGSGNTSGRLTEKFRIGKYGQIGIEAGPQVYVSESATPPVINSTRTVDQRYGAAGEVIKSTGATTSVEWSLVIPPIGSTTEALYGDLSDGVYSYRQTNLSDAGIHHFRSDDNITNSLKAYVKGNGQYHVESDYRLKENVLSLTNGIETVKKLNPISFDWKGSGRSDIGFLAHELQSAVPTAVDGNKDQMKSDGVTPFYQFIAKDGILPHLTAALKEAIAKIETLEAKVAALESK